MKKSSTRERHSPSLYEESSEDDEWRLCEGIRSLKRTCPRCVYTMRRWHVISVCLCCENVLQLWAIHSKFVEMGKIRT